MKVDLKDGVIILMIYYIYGVAGEKALNVVYKDSLFIIRCLLLLPVKSERIVPPALSPAPQVKWWQLRMSPGIHMAQQFMPNRLSLE